jgi:hypothetical protein
MNRPAAPCPNCSAPLTFAWSGSVQTVCAHCRAIIVRHDLDLARVGEVSDPPPDTSLIQLGTTGRFDKRAFTVIGRIAYEYEGGAWSEWHVLFEDRRTGWLSDAQLRYAVYERVSDQVKAPPAGELRVGHTIRVRDREYEVTTITDARYRGTEGELPFESWDRQLARFADLQSTERRVGTIDYTDQPPSVYVGRSVPFAELSLRNLRPVDRSRVVPVGALKCRNCAAPLVIRAAGHSQSVVCDSCGSIADATDPNVGIVQEAGKRERRTPKIPLGASGEWRGARYEVVGFQRRVIYVDGVEYGWDEYVLFNPEQGFRYLSEYEGHWSDIVVVDEKPSGLGTGQHAVRELNGRTFKHFQSAQARTDYVLGEFPWVVRVGETVQVHDYSSPPLVLSCEGTSTEATWSLGTYVKGEELWRAFSVDGRPPSPVGVYVNQPSPYADKVWPAWRMFVGLAAALLVLAAVRLATSDRTVFQGRYLFDPSSQNAAFVTDPFTLDGRPSSVGLSVDTNLSNNWMFVNLSLINEGTNVALDVGRELEYYFGVEDGESWSSGSRRGNIVVPSVPPGHYYLRVEPEGDAASQTPVTYSIVVRRDSPVWVFYGIAIGLLAVPPLLISWRHHAFEHRRWSESDYGGGSDDEDDGGDDD